MDGSPSSLRMVLVLTVMTSLFSLLSVTPSEGQTTSITSSGLGTTISPPSIDPAGRPNYTITGGTRPGDGPNLFHSFGDFSVGTNNVARFFNETGRSTTNILSRVTGGQTSNIYGTIQTAGFGTAALWLINPAGIVFGPTASLNVGGSVHFSTADYLRLGSGNDRFYADLGKTSQLTSAPVTAFGFLNSNPAAIAVKGSNMAVPNGQTLSLVGGNRTFPDPDNPSVSVPSGVTMTGGSLSTPGGQIDIVSGASKGEVVLVGSQATGPTLSGFDQLGSVSLSKGARLDTSVAPSPLTDIEATAAAAGPIHIRSGQLVMDGSFIAAKSRGFKVPIVSRPASTTGGPIDIEAQTITLTNQSEIKTEVFTGTFSSVDASGETVTVTYFGNTRTICDCTVTAGAIDIKANSMTGTEGSISAQGGSIIDISPGIGGAITIHGMGNNESNLLNLQNFNLLAGTSASVNAQGGPIQLLARDILLDNVRIDNTGLSDGDLSLISSNSIQAINSTISSRTQEGTAGIILIDGGRELDLKATNVLSDGGLIGAGGEITVSANQINLSGGSIKATANGFLDSGTIILAGQQITLSNQASIATDSTGKSFSGAPFLNSAGSAGKIAIHGTGAAGSMANNLLVDNSSISTTTTNGKPTNLPATIEVNAQTMNLVNSAQIRTDSSGVANAGDIHLTSGDNISIANSTVSTEATQASGGNIEVTAPNLVRLVGANLTSSVAGPPGSNGGNITVDTAHPQFVIIQDNSQILAKANEGQGGRITIIGGVVLQEPGSVLDATAGPAGISGTINIQSPIQQLSGAIAPLPQAFAVATNLYGQRCATQKGGQFSSFVEGARDGVPPQPGDLIPSPLLLESEGISPSLASQSSPNLAAVRLGLPDFYHPAPVTFLLSTGCRS
jgi:filamentous hemagglutinin family protein